MVFTGRMAMQSAIESETQHRATLDPSSTLHESHTSWLPRCSWMLALQQHDRLTIRGWWLRPYFPTKRTIDVIPHRQKAAESSSTPSVTSSGFGRWGRVGAQSPGGPGVEVIPDGVRAISTISALIHPAADGRQLSRPFKAFTPRQSARGSLRTLYLHPLRSCILSERSGWHAQLTDLRDEIALPTEPEPLTPDPASARRSSGPNREPLSLAPAVLQSPGKNTCSAIKPLVFTTPHSHHSSKPYTPPHSTC